MAGLLIAGCSPLRSPRTQSVTSLSGDHSIRAIETLFRPVEPKQSEPSGLPFRPYYMKLINEMIRVISPLYLEATLIFESKGLVAGLTKGFEGGGIRRDNPGKHLKSSSV